MAGFVGTLSNTVAREHSTDVTVAHCVTWVPCPVSPRALLDQPTPTRRVAVHMHATTAGGMH